MKLNALPLHQEAIIESVHVANPMRQRLLDFGLTPQTPIRCVGYSPSSDPSAYLIRGAVLAIRTAESCQIDVLPISQSEVPLWNQQAP